MLEDIKDVPPGDIREGAPPIKCSRRTFIKALLLATLGSGTIDTVISHIPSIKQERSGFSRLFWEQIESGAYFSSAEALKKDMEEQYQIEFISSKDNLTDFIRESQKELLYAKYISLTDWDAPRLKALSAILEFLPKCFYQPKEVGGVKTPLKMALIELDRILAGFLGVAFFWKGENNSGLIAYDKISLGQTLFEKKLSQTIIVHELAHYATVDKISDLQKSILDPIGLGSESSLQQTFQNDSPEELRNSSSTHFALNYAGEKFEEFFAVASEFYVQGEKEFISAFVKKIGIEKAKILYKNVQREIFEGREY